MERRRKERNQNPIPPDLVYEILDRLPFQSIVRFLLVSKQWATIIRSRDFIRSFKVRSSLQTKKPRLLAALAIKDNDNSLENWQFFSSTSAHVKEGKSLSLISTCACPNDSAPRINSPSYVQGLMSFGYGQVQAISNPSTGTCLTLPKIKSIEMKFQSFFGYDPVNDEYKVLASSASSSEHYVYTLGSSGVGWREFECKFRHYPETDGLCIDGNMYYGARIYKPGPGESWLVRFDMKTENLDPLIRLPNGHSFDYHLINYKGKVASVKRTSSCTFDLRVLEDVEGTVGSGIHISIRPWKKLFEGDSLEIKGILHTGEIMFAPTYHSGEYYYVIFYDRKRNRLSKTFVRTNENIKLGVSFLDYVETLELL